MQVWVLPIALFSVVAYGESNIIPIGYEVPENVVFEKQNAICESIVCRDVVETQLVPKVGDVPKREGNKTIEAIGSVVYVFSDANQTDDLLKIEKVINIFFD
ncbi:hypothetical protein DS893_00715 [Vibrionales bacterium C3R12]|nr:hypothetical protein DS893_00715 [Vibrionales bacterium C3R12]